MSWITIALQVFEFLLLIAQRYLLDTLREEGRQEVLNEQATADEKAHDRAAEIDRDVADSDLDALRDRMRDYQRPSDAL